MEKLSKEDLCPIYAGKLFENHALATITKTKNDNETETCSLNRDIMIYLDRTRKVLQFGYAIRNPMDKMDFELCSIIASGRARRRPFLTIENPGVLDLLVGGKKSTDFIIEKFAMPILTALFASRMFKRLNDEMTHDDIK